MIRFYLSNHQSSLPPPAIAKGRAIAAAESSKSDIDSLLFAEELLVRRILSLPNRYSLAFVKQVSSQFIFESTLSLRISLTVSI